MRSFSRGGQMNCGRLDEGKIVEVRAPMSGVFFRRPGPDQPPYVEEGDVVRKKQVLALLETMKVFQKIKSPIDGKVLRVTAENETALKDNELMFVMERL
jgi:biotin carboxyl carrier protein